MTSHKSQYPHMHKPYCLGRTKLSDCQGCADPNDREPKFKLNINLDALVSTLQEALDVLVRDGALRGEHVGPTSRNQAQALLGFLAPEGDFVPLVEEPPDDLANMTREDLIRECEKLANIIADDMGVQALEGRVESLEKELAVVEKFREAEGVASDLTTELLELQKQRADTNAKILDEALEQTKAALDRKEDEKIALQRRYNQSKDERRRLRKVNENITNQLRRAEAQARRGHVAIKALERDKHDQYLRIASLEEEKLALETRVRDFVAGTKGLLP